METIKEIFSDLIDDPKDAMRSGLDRGGLFDLADDIKKNGLINPITVRPVLCDGGTVSESQPGIFICTLCCKPIRYEVVAGHRRLGACKIAGKIKIPCVVKELDDRAAFSIMASENLVREDVDPVDEAEFIIKMMNRTGQSIDEVAQNIRRGRQCVEDRLIVANMPDYLKEYLRAKQIKLGAALALNKIANENTKRMWVDMAVRDGVSVKVAEYWLYQWGMQQLPGGIDSAVPSSDLLNNEPQAVLFECAIDGKKYDARLFRTVMIYEGNLSVFNSIVSELRTLPAQN